MLKKSCLFCKHRVVLARRKMFIDFEREEDFNKKIWECDRVDIGKLPNIREIIAASFKGEAIKAEVIAKECNQFYFRTNKEEITSICNGSPIIECISRDTTELTNSKLIDEQPEKANCPLDDENFFRSSAAWLTEAVPTLMTEIAIYNVKSGEQAKENVDSPYSNFR